MVAKSHMEEARRTIKELAGIQPEGAPIVSLYLDTKWFDEHQRERARLFLAQRAAALVSSWKGRPGGKELAEDLHALVRMANRDLIQQGDPAEVSWEGFAFFSSKGRNLRAGLRTRVRLENELEVEEQPRLLQLARVMGDDAPAFVVLVDGRWVRIFEVALGAAVVEMDIEQYLPGRVDTGDRGPFAKRWTSPAGQAALARGDGLSQMRYQRHVRHHLEQNLRNAAGLLGELVGHELGAPIVMCGEEELRAAFRRLMPEPIRRLVMVEMRLDSKAPRHRVLQEAVTAIHAVREALIQREVDSVVGRAISGELAVLGTEDTLLALNESRLHTLYISAEPSYGLGWRCTACKAFGDKAEVGCPFCQGATSTVDLRQEIVRRALAADARVVVVPHHVRLRHFRGMAGSLRRGLNPSAPGIGYTAHEPLQ